MAKSIAATSFVIATVFILGGCGTIDNLATQNKGLIYGGTRTDFGAVCGNETRRGEEQLIETRVGAGVLALVDLPFSVVADTLTMPYLLYADHKSQSEAKAAPAKDSSSRAPGGATAPLTGSPGGPPTP